MKNVRLALRNFIKQPSTITGILKAMMFQLIFSLVWMTGYDGVSNNMERLKLAIVLEDQAATAVLSPLASQLLFDVTVTQSLSEAEAQLNKREVHLVMLIPQGFLQAVQSSGHAEMEFLINESNPVMLKGTTQAIASQLTQQLNQASLTPVLNKLLPASAA